MDESLDLGTAYTVRHSAKSLVSESGELSEDIRLDVSQYNLLLRKFVHSTVSHHMPKWFRDRRQC